MTSHRDMNREKLLRRLFEVSIIVSVLICFLLITGCTQSSGTPYNRNNTVWETIKLTDVRTGEIFTINSLSDRPVLIQSFIITCPICMKQQEEITRLAESGNVSFVMIGLDIDPNSNAELLKQYTEQKGYVGRYAHSPPLMTQSLVDQFGMPILTPSQAPLILICPDGTATLLPSGIKTMQGLEQILAGCPR